MTRPNSLRDGQLSVRPIVRDAAREWLRRHRHLPPPRNTWLLGASVHDGERLCAVAIVERPARLLQDGTTACVSRLCTDRTEHAAGKALGAVTRACIALGYRRLVSYTLLGEKGTPYRANGWQVTAIVKGEATHGRAGRARDPQVQPGRKVRWEYGPDAAPRDPEAEALMLASVGAVSIPERSELWPDEQKGVSTQMTLEVLR